MKINHPAPDFELPDLNGGLHRLSDYRGRVVIVNFWSCECPHSERTDKAIMAMFVQWRDDVVMLSIAANRSENVEAVKTAADARSLPTVLIDALCVVADLYEAQTTPHVYVIDREGILRYRGAIARADGISGIWLRHCARSLIESNRDRIKATSQFNQ